MLAERLPGILPMLDDDHALEVTAVHSVAGALTQDGCLVRVPPFQAPHHTASMAALVGGGPGLARAGSISLAHRGVLFLDEARNTTSTPAVKMVGGSTRQGVSLDANKVCVAPRLTIDPGNDHVMPEETLYLEEAVQAAQAHSESNRYHKAEGIFVSEQVEPVVFACACGWQVRVKRDPGEAAY